MSGFRFKAVLVGALLDIVGSMVAFAILRAVLGSGWQGGRPPLVLQDAFGLAFTFLGGLTAARLARRRELVHAVSTAVPCFLLGLLLPLDWSLPAWHIALSRVGVFPIALLGGYCGRGWNRADGLTSQ
jgi:hypothetical protein